MLVLFFSAPKIFYPSGNISDLAQGPESDPDSSTGLAQPSLPGDFHMDYEENTDPSTNVHYSDEQAMVEVKEDTKQGLIPDPNSDIGLSQLLPPYSVLNSHEDIPWDLANNEETVKEVNEKSGAGKKSDIGETPNTEKKSNAEKKSYSEQSTTAVETSLPGAFINSHEESIDNITNVKEATRKARKVYGAIKYKLTLDGPPNGTTEVNAQNSHGTEASYEEDPQQVLLDQLSTNNRYLMRELAWERRSKDIILDTLYIKTQQVECLQNELNATGGIKLMNAFSYVNHKSWEYRLEADSLRGSLAEANKQLEEREDAKSGTKRSLGIAEESSPIKRQKVDGVSDRVAEMMEEIRSLRVNNNKLILSLGEKDAKLNEKVTRISDLFEEGKKLLDRKEVLEKEVHLLRQLGANLKNTFFQQANQTSGILDDGEFERTMSREIDEWEQEHGSRIVDITGEDEEAL